MVRGRHSTASGVWQAAVALLRRPVVIVTEVVAFGAGAALAASLPQQPDAEAIRRFAEASPLLGRMVAALGLHEIVTSLWFLALAGLCLLSLVAVQAQQWPRLGRTWRSRLEVGSFARAAFRRAVPIAAARAIPPAPRLSSAGRLGLLGSPVFHLGLLVLVGAGLVRLLTFRDVIARAFEGDAFAAAPGAFEAERGGWLSRPFALPRPLRLEEIREERYESGALKQVNVRLGLAEASGQPARVEEAAINHPLDIGDIRLYVASAHGVAAVLEITGPSGPTPLVAFLEERGGEWRGGLRPTAGLEVRFRTNTTPRPTLVETRVLWNGMLLGIRDLEPSASFDLGGGHRLRLHGLPYWVQLRGTRDPSKPLFFAGVAIGIAGVILLFGFNRVDAGVFVEGDDLVIALRPLRFAPLYAERFERLCKEWIA
jgi:cytochrome c biogenesis protein ResB